MANEAGGNSGSGSGGSGSGNTNGDGDSDKYRDLAAMSLSSKIPEFWTDRPTLWFLQAEAMLAPQHLSDQVKFNLIITKLSKDTIAQVTDILLKPPSTEKFKALKDRLIQVYEETENRQIQKLISEMELGEQKPSQLLRRMRELAKDRVPDETLNVLWQGHLPASVRTVLAVADIKALDSLAKVADKVLENSKPLFVSEVSNNIPSNSETNTDKILKEIAKLHLRINQVSDRNRRARSSSRNSSNRRRSVSRNSNKPRRTEASPDWLCFYHFRFKERASKCVEPCNWKKQGN